MLRDMESLLQKVEEGLFPQFKTIRLGGLFGDRDEYRQRLCELGASWTRLGITWGPNLQAWHGGM
ncbi:hypothetical protein CALVIDRAFT_538982 [Calocera viscosa TUFC12733]|uniref:Uncharacterized protein n=1 Tax=Calocera viscosa (strain TUFC12733) TaxID=1330018 RepID=A0A167KDG1_CALVF|nr:hypothetical protein CALVIDRAFT_538982 [Calocera viscosa TUFC12733]